MAETPRRFVRVPDELWQAADAKAKRRNKNMSEIIRALLALWVIVHDPDDDPDDVAQLATNTL
jgi:hypothetical protein